MAEVVESEVVIGKARSLVKQAGDTTAKQAVVFVHGYPGPSDDWDFILPRVGDFARAVAFDMPGYGRADRPRDFDYTVSGYARHLAYGLQEIGVRRAHLVMHDFGGAWGMQWAVMNSKALRSVTFINSVGGVLRDYEWHTAAKIWQTPVLGELFMLAATRTAIKLSLNADNPNPMPDSFIDQVTRYNDWGHKRAVLRLYRASKDIQAMTRVIQEDLEKIDVPVLVIWGAEDPYLPSYLAEAQKELFPNAEVHALEGCGHWPFVDDPERVAGLLLPFLEEQVGKNHGGSS